MGNGHHLRALLLAGALAAGSHVAAATIGTPGRCPPGISGAPFIGSPNDATCTFMLDLNFWDVPASDPTSVYALGHRAQWGLAGRGGTAFVYSTAHAKAIGDTFPAGSQALISLRPSGGAWAWSWTGTGSGGAPAASTYGVSTPQAWVNGTIPPTSAGPCVVLTSEGLLKAVPCTHAEVPRLAIAIKTCCPTCRMVEPNEQFGFKCTPYNLFDVVFDVQSYIIIPGYNRTISSATAFPNSVYLDPGCGSLSWQPTDVRAMAPVQLHGGDVMRICGDIPSSQSVTALLLRPPGSNIGFRCPAQLGLTTSQCKEYDSTAGLDMVPDVAVDITPVLTSGAMCASLTQTPGSAACWTSSGLLPGEGNYLVRVTTVSAYATSDYACVLAASDRGVYCQGSGPAVQNFPSANAWYLVTGRAHACYINWQGVIQCWGDNSRGQGSVPAGLPMVSRLSAGRDHTCAVASHTGALYCWGDGSESVPTDLPPLDNVFTGPGKTCANPSGGGKVRCWFTAGTLEITVPADIKGVFRVEFAATGMCAILAETGLVRCWGADNPALEYPPPDLPPVTALALDGMGGCAVLVSNGSITCWGARGNGTIGVTAVRGGDVLDSGFGNNVLNGLWFPGGLETKTTFYLSSVEWTAGKILMRKMPGTVLPITLPAAHFNQRFRAARMRVQLYLQGSADSPPRTVDCPFVRVYSAYEQQCESGLVDAAYGASIEYWNGTQFVSYGLSNPERLSLRSAQVFPSSLRAGFVAPPYDTLPLARALALLPPDGSGSMNQTLPSLLPVRPGDTVSLLGSGFGLHAALVPGPVAWWSPSPALGQILRSCIHLAWWANNASYLDDAACVCNGQEDWLGEGEVPHTSIQAWDDETVRFTVPPGEGIREIRLCVEGRGFLAANRARSTPSVYLLYEPPALVDMLPSTFVESTDTDTDASLQVALTAPEVVGANSFRWGHCNMDLISADVDPRVPGRLPLKQALPAAVASSALRHCTASLTIADSFDRCYRVAGWANSSSLLSKLSSASASSAAMLSLSARCSKVLQPVDSAEDNALVLTFPLLQPLPSALLNLSFSITTWDAGLPIAWGPDLSTVTFTRSPPVLKAINPNPLLLGPIGGQNEATTGRYAVLTMFGPGFRTREEIMDPVNALLGRSPDVQVWVDRFPCYNASVVRTNSSFAYTTCIYPAELAGGGEHTVRIRMADIDTVIAPGDGNSLALYSACDVGFYGLFAPGHQRCLPCPEGAVCKGGIGQAPRAAAGFYNVALPTRMDKTAPSLHDAPLTTANSLAGPCPDRVKGSNAGRDIACIMPCEPPEACEEDNLCAKGYVSLHPTYRCSSCAPHFFRSSGVCTPCPVLGVGAILLLIFGLLLVAGTMFIFSSNAIRLCTVNTVLEYTQLISLLQGPTLPWPTSIKDTLRSISVFRINIEITAPECYTDLITPESKLWAVAVLPMIVLVMAGTCYLVLGLGKQLLLRSAVISSGAWAHGPPLCRLVLKLMGALYLPVLQACLQVFNCTQTSPPDGYEYLTIAFEQCGIEGGLQSRMKPWAVAGLVLYGAMYPILLLVFFWVKNDVIVEDQLLLAAGVGDDRKTNPRAYTLRTYAAPLYEDFRPGYHYAALMSLGRKALVCICALMLNKSPVLVSAGIVLVLVVALTFQATVHPLMTPGYGYAAALAQFGGRLQVGRDPKAKQMQRYLNEIASRTRAPALVELAAGQALCTDVAGAAKPLWAAAIDWNLLESQLQLQVIVVGLLSVMYNAATDSVYAERAPQTVTAIFFTILFLAACHIGMTVGYDFLLQLSSTLRSLLGLDTKARPSHELPWTHARGMHPTEYGWGGLQGLAHAGVKAWHVACLFFCRCCMTRERARGLVFGLKPNASVTEDAECLPVSEWTANPLDKGNRSPTASDTEWNSSTCRAWGTQEPPHLTPRSPRPSDPTLPSPSRVAHTHVCPSPVHTPRGTSAWASSEMDGQVSTAGARFAASPIARPLVPTLSLGKLTLGGSALEDKDKDNGKGKGTDKDAWTGVVNVDEKGGSDVSVVNPLRGGASSVTAVPKDEASGGTVTVPRQGTALSSLPVSKQGRDRLASMQQSSRFVQVAIDQISRMREAPLPEDWRPIRSSYIALWELVEFEREAGRRRDARLVELQAQLEDLQKSHVSSAQVAAACAPTE